jgi:hypothetical protein
MSRRMCRIVRRYEGRMYASKLTHRWNFVNWERIKNAAETIGVSGASRVVLVENVSRFSSRPRLRPPSPAARSG